MLINLRRSLVMCLFALAVFGFLYAFAGIGASQLLFRSQANGSLTADGSVLIGQNWTSAKFFHGRPDDAGPYAAVVCAAAAKSCTPSSGGDNPLEANGVAGESAATNLGPRSKILLADTKELIAYWHRVGVDPTADLVTTSGSGYDPDITPLDASVQIPMVTRATGIPPRALRALIARETHPAELGFLGSSYVDVLQLNEALSRLG